MIAWITSYPKSGNTWVRAFLTAYIHSEDGKFKFNLLDNIQEFPQHYILNKFMKSENFHSLKEVSKYWIRAQEIINSKNKTIFLKTHSSLCHINDNMFTNKDNTLFFIYIVRDPRNVVLSTSNHFGISQEESYKIINNENYIIYPKINNQILPATLISSWKNHYLSWKSEKSVKNIIIKYEDLIENTTNTFEKLTKFLNEHAKIEYDKKKVINSINSTKFDILKNQEDKYGFNMGQKDKFFYLGRENNWKKLLDQKINNKICESFKSEMEELGYI
tara:strand:+ start:2669 stop:3493 length:825 start_codon:yes stop_codon:yes gene_type:complete